MPALRPIPNGRISQDRRPDDCGFVAWNLRRNGQAVAAAESPGKCTLRHHSTVASAQIIEKPACRTATATDVDRQGADKHPVADDAMSLCMVCGSDQCHHAKT